jgi:hypothetical protein
MGKGSSLAHSACEGDSEKEQKGRHTSRVMALAPSPTESRLCFLCSPLGVKWVRSGSNGFRTSTAADSVLGKNDACMTCIFRGSTPIRCAHGMMLGSPRRCSGSSASELERDDSLDSPPPPCSSPSSAPAAACRISALKRDESLGSSSSSSPSSSSSARDEPESEAAMSASSSTRRTRGAGNGWCVRDGGGFLGGEATYFSSSLVSLGRAVKRTIEYRGNSRQSGSTLLVTHKVVTCLVRVTGLAQGCEPNQNNTVL